MTDHTTTDAQTKARTAIADMQAARDELNAEHQRLTLRFSELDQRRGALLSAPLRREDAKAFVLGLVKQAAAGFEQDAGLASLFRQLGTSASPLTVEHVVGAERGAKHPILIPLNRLFGGELINPGSNARLEFGRMCYFFPEQITGRLGAVFDRYAVNLSDAGTAGVAAMDVDKRLEELQRLDDDMAAVERRLEELRPELQQLASMLALAGG